MGARDLRECLLLQIESLNGEGGVAWQIVSNHLRLLETRQYRNWPRCWAGRMEHIQIAVSVIQHLEPASRPALLGSGRAGGGAGRLHHPRTATTTSFR